MSWSTKKYNRGFNQFFTIKEYDETSGYIVKNISGYNITLIAKQGDTLLISGVLTIASSTLGYAYYTVQSGDFSYTGAFDYELELVKGSEKIETETHKLSVGRTL